MTILYIGLICLLFMLIIAMYFIPYIVAFEKDHKNKTAIGLLNLFFGWTGIGWVIAIIWAFLSGQSRRTIKPFKKVIIGTLITMMFICTITGVVYLLIDEIEKEKQAMKYFNQGMELFKQSEDEFKKQMEALEKGGG